MVIVLEQRTGQSYCECCACCVKMSVVEVNVKEKAIDQQQQQWKATVYCRGLAKVLINNLV